MPLQTFFTSPSKGTGVRGVERDKLYSGTYDDQNRRHGHGTYRYPNHMVYTGDYVHGAKHGQGKLQFADGGWYEGAFEHDEINGTGTRRFPNGNVYTGGFKMGEMHGTGTMAFANGDTFEGTFVRNVMEGKGTKLFKNGDVYKGDFSCNRINGMGSMKYKNGDVYEGRWQDGKRTGQGKCVYGYGDVYEGEWQADLPHGEGVLDVLQGNLRYEGTFVAGKPQQVPSKMNVSFMLRSGTATGKKPAKGAPVEETPLLPVTLGTPLACAITLCAQHEIPLTQEEKDAIAAAAAPPPKGAPRPPTPSSLPPAPVITERASTDRKWETCAMESQRLVHLTLHPGPPQPLPKGRLIGLCIANVLDKETGVARLRVILLPALLERPLPIARTEDGEVLHGLEAKLSRGAVEFENLVIGSSEPDSPDNEALATPTASGCLVASSWSIRPGYCKVQLPEYKEKKK